MAYDARAIANCFLGIAKQNGSSLTPMKVQKLIYFAHGWHLALHDKPLVVDPIQAWQYGPVISSVYQEFKSFGSGAITFLAKDFDFESLRFHTPQVDIDDDSTKTLLNTIWDVYGQLTAVQLSNLSHVKDGPWEKARFEGDNGKSALIRDELIRDYFVQVAEKKKAQAA